MEIGQNEMMWCSSRSMPPNITKQRTFSENKISDVELKHMECLRIFDVASSNILQSLLLHIVFDSDAFCINVM